MDVEVQPEFEECCPAKQRMTSQVPRVFPELPTPHPTNISDPSSRYTNTTNHHNDNRLPSPQQLIHNLDPPSPTTTHHIHVNRLPIPTTLLLPTLLHATTHRLNALLATNILVHPHPNLLPPQPHLQPLARRRAQHAFVPQLHPPATPQPARRKSYTIMDVHARRRQPR
jgi:hypothetical protein